MNDRLVPRNQFSAAVFTALLSPLMRVLPRAAVALAGRGAWLSVLPAVPVLGALAVLMTALRRQLRPGEGMADLILRRLGPIAGRLVLLLYAAWFLFYAGFILHSGAARLTATVYQQSGEGPFLLLMLALCLLAALGTLRAAGRMAVLLRAILLGVLALVSLLALPNVEPENLFPLTPDRGPDIVLGAWPVITVGGVAALFSFLNAYVEPAEKPRMAGALALFSLTAGVLCLETVGTFGAALTLRLRYPFFTMIRDVSLWGLAQRIESVVIALWVFADFMLVTLLLRCAHEALRVLLARPRGEDLPTFCLKRGRWLLWGEAALALAAAGGIAPSSERLLLWTETLVPVIMDLFVFGGFPLLWLVGRLRKND